MIEMSGTTEPAGVNPYSTGGGGVSLERRVAVAYLADLLTGATRPELHGRLIRRVLFQVGPAHRVDDLMIVAEREDASDPFELNVAVRRAPDFVTSEVDTKKLFSALITDLPEPEPRIAQRRLAICVAGQQAAARQVSQLTTLAQGQVTQEGFFALVRAPRRFDRGLVERLRHLVNLVQNSLPDTGDGVPMAVAQEMTWRLLCHLDILMPRIEPPDETDWGRLLNDLQPWAREPTVAAAAALRDRLVALTADYGPVAAEVDLTKLRRDAHDVLHSIRRRQASGWAELRRLEVDARSAVRASLGVDGVEPSLNLPRPAAATKLRSELDARRPVLVTGESGVGKSALVLAELTAAAADTATYDVVYLNLRLLPPTTTQLRQALGVPLEDLFAEMSAPVRILVIDGADVAIEREDHLLHHILWAARSRDVTPWVIAAVDAAAAVRAIATSAMGEVRDVIVEGLQDAELEEIARVYPRLRRLVDEPRAKELLRRPAVVDLFVRAGTGDVPLSDADALDIVWSQLVRSNGSRARGLPEAREQVVFQLARLQLRQADPATATLALDPSALSGLVHDGVLRRSDRWQTLPRFAHDLVRTYAVAAVLQSTGDPVREILTAGAPRWTLPAARLAAQTLLAAPHSVQDPLAGRFDRLQASFDRLVLAGHGDRWGDLPTEALLTLPTAGALITNAWPTLAAGDANGLRRLIRVVQQRHGGAAIIERLTAEPIVGPLLEHGWPKPFDETIDRVLCLWLRGLARDNEPPGHVLRIALRSNLVAQVAAGDSRLAEERRLEAAQLAARTPEQIAEDEQQASRIALISGYPTDHPRRQRARSVPNELIHDALLEQLALLGADLGPAGEGLLRRVAADAPHHLAPAVEAFMAGRSIASYSVPLLTELTNAYYIEDHGLSHGPGHDGIRHHELGPASPLAAFYKGPFLALLQADPASGVASLNRMLNHAVRSRLAVLRGTPDDAASPPQREHVVELDITGQRSQYIGDPQTWLWYRGTGVGPYPCMSALLALEIMCDRWLNEGVEPARLVKLLLDGCENLAMPAFVVGMLTRHLERVDAELDPFLAEPAVWRLEFVRTVHEGSGLAVHTEGIVAPERRRWNLREVAAWLVVSASEDRAQILQFVAQRLVQRATEIEASGSGGDELLHGLTAVHGWAASLNRDNYTLTRTDEGIRIEWGADPDMGAHPVETNAEFARSDEAASIVLRYPERFDRHVQRHETTADAIVADISLAQRLIEAQPTAAPFDAYDAAATVAAAALEARFIHQIDIPDHELTWSARVLVDLMNELADHGVSLDDLTAFGNGPDRGAARGLPLLLLPEAGPIRERLAAEGVEPAAIARATAWIVEQAANETRLFLARAYDPLWHTPCGSGDGVCHHHTALAVLENIARDCLIGDYDFQQQRSRRVHISGPVVPELTATTHRIYVPQLTATIRGSSAAAASSACCRNEATALLTAALDAHRRGMRAFDHAYMHSSDDAAAAARAVLDLAAAGNSSLLFAHLDGYADYPMQLSEALRALVAAGEETQTRAAAARVHWPAVLNRVMELTTTGSENRERHSDRQAPLADVMPAPSYESGYLHREIHADPIMWADPMALAPQIETWIPLVVGQPGPLDALIHMLYRLPPEQQAATGLPWIDQLVMPRPNSIARQSFLLPRWLRSVQPHAVASGPQAAWHRIVDALTVAGDDRVAALAD